MKQLLILVSLVSFSAFGQFSIPENYDTIIRKQEVILKGSFDYGATAIQNDFQSKLIRGGFISNEIKDFAWNKHKGINRVGADLHGEIEYRNYASNLFGKERYGWLIRAGAYAQGGMIYSKDVFGFAFYGNEQYVGSNADFTGTRASMMSFQKIGFGVIDKKSKSTIAVNFVTANSSLGANMRDVSIYQNADVDSMLFIYDGVASYKNGGFNRPGLGFGIDADFRVPIQIMKNNVSFFQFSIKNLGGVFIPSSTVYEADSSLIFKGFTFDQLIGNASIIDSNFSILDTLNIRSEDKSSFQLLPVFVQFGKIIDDLNTNKVQAFYGVRLFPTLYFIPQIYAGVNYKPIKQLSVGASAAYGGFTNFRCGLYLAGNVKSMSVGLSTENLIGLFSKNGFGKSAALRLSWRI
ncbi:MAG: hypothetical protein V4638_06515 [Bacteroidota bacterium]